MVKVAVGPVGPTWLAALAWMESAGLKIVIEVVGEVNTGAGLFFFFFFDSFEISVGLADLDLSARVLTLAAGSSELVAAVEAVSVLP